MPALPSEYSCPTCKSMTGAAIQIFANLGELQCANGHRWNDYNAFMSLKPIMEFQPQLHKPLPQENHTPLTVSVPIWLADAMKSKYGEKLSATIGSVMRELLEGEALVVSPTDVQRITDKLGTKPKNSNELYGLIYSMMCSVDDAKNERDAALQDLKAYEGMSPGRVVVDLGGNYQTVLAKAKDSEPPLPVKIWIETQLKTWIDNGWI